MNASHESKNSLLMSQFMHKGAKNKNNMFDFDATKTFMAGNFAAS